MVLEVIYAVVDGILPAAEAQIWLASETVAGVAGMDLLVADLLEMVSIETQYGPQADDAKRRPRLVKLVAACRTKGWPEAVVLHERLSSTLQCDAGLVQSVAQTDTSVKRLRTTMFYKQQKYNLLREEAEGYSKLATELNTLDGRSVSEMMVVIQSLIGSFALDPNRYSL